VHPRPQVPRLPRGSVDFFALYIIPTDDWYIIPYAVIGKRYATLHFTPDGPRQKHGKYQEAWHLLLNATKSRSKKTIEIRACCGDDEDAANPGGEKASAQSARDRAKVRRMFRGLFQGRGTAGHIQAGN
jgi:hypothetical protein